MVELKERGIFMEYLLLALAASGTTFQNVMAKRFNTKESIRNPFFYSMVVAFTAMIFFVVSAGFKLNFNIEFLPYSIIFGVFFAIASVGNVYAMENGPMSLTSLVLSLSLILPTMFGIIVLDDPIGIFKYVGIFLLIVAIVLINIKNEKGTKLSLKWAIYALLTFICNGGCTIAQKMQQLAFDGAYKSEFMIVSLVIVWVSLFLFGLKKHGDKKEMLKIAAKYAAPAGLANGMVNLLIMILTGMLPTAVLFPSISAGGMALTFMLALTIFKEKLSKTQTIGYIAGIISVVLLNL